MRGLLFVLIIPTGSCLLPLYPLCLNRANDMKKIVYQKDKITHPRNSARFRQRIFASIAIPVFILSTVLGAILPSSGSASAATTLDDAPLKTKALSYTYLNSLRWCVANSSVSLKDDDFWGEGVGTRITDANAKAGKWFTDHAAWDIWRFEPHRAAASFLDPNVNDTDTDAGKTMCNSILNAAYKIWGYDTPIQLLCSFVSTRQNGSSCETGNGDFGKIDGLADALYTAVKKKVYGGDNPTLYMDKYKDQGGYPARYLYYERAFFDGCNAKESTTATGNFKYSGVRIISGDGASSTKDYEGLDHSTKRFVYTDRDGPSQLEKTCKEIADAMNTYADAYKAYALGNKGEEGAPGGGSGLDCSENPDIVGCEAGASSCVIDGVGWIVCTGANFMASVSDGIYSLISLMISTPAINVDTSSGTNGVYNAWTIMRSFANVAFVIVFLIIIFSQLTGVGVTNYGVKKTLPRLVVAAILVNLSFWISAIAVDVSNIAGKGIYDILSGVKDSMNIGISSNWGSIITALLAGSGIAIPTAAAGAVGVVAIGAIASTEGGGLALAFLAIPLVLAAVLAILILIFILIARQAMVIILIIISPLAFVAMLLPNTEKLFVMWRRTLVSLLLMYPIVSLIFGGAQIAGLAILSSAAGADPLLGGVYIITGQLVMVAPFFFLPVILRKFSGGNLESMAANITSKANKALSGVNKMSRAAGTKRMGRTWNRMKYGTNNSTKGGRVGSFLRGSASVAGQAGTKYDQFQDRNTLADDFLKKERGEATQNRLATDSAYALKITGGDQAKATKLQARAIAANRAEDLKTASSTLSDELAQVKSGTHPTHVGTNTDDFLQTRATSTAHAEIEQEAAMNEAVRQGRDKVVRALGANPAADQQALQRAIAAGGGSLAAKAPDLVKPASSAFGTIKGEELASFTASTAQKHIEYIEQLHSATQLPGATAADQQALETAVMSFNSAVTDISSNPTLQAKFGGDVGKEYEARIAALDPVLQNKLGAAAGIQQDGKIR